MAEFAVGDVVRLNGSNITMCVEALEGDGTNDAGWVNVMWFDHVGQLHRDGFDPRCLVKITAHLGPAIVPAEMHDLILKQAQSYSNASDVQVPFEGKVS